MYADTNAAWTAGATSRSGDEEQFDSPKCMLRWRLSDAGRGAREVWVTEYYSQSRTPAADVLFVEGSDVVGPMGKDMVPVKGREEAERFRREHHGRRVLSLDRIDAAALRALDAE